ncbi:MAG TPA: hypothetical protein VLA79_19240, partial [Polyangia bacterium]|nr:hypothetical protein [Polyangia bacterium]
MKLREQLAEQEVQAVIERGRHIRRAPDVVRARLLARARVAVAASAHARRLGIPETAPAWRGRRLAFAAAALLLFSAAGATAALYAHTWRSAEIGPTRRGSPETPSVRAAAPRHSVSEVEPAPEVLSSPKIQRSHRVLS